MIHARKDYMRFQDPALEDPSLLGEDCTPIGEDEPVFLLRAKDKHFPNMLTYYVYLLSQDENSQQDMIDACIKHRRLAAEWQINNGRQTPDMPREE